jgi:hypothetical protein
LIALGPLLAGLLFVQLERPRVEAATLRELGSVARLKANPIELWLRERDGDASIMQASMSLGINAGLLMADPKDQIATLAVRERLQGMLDAYGYHCAVLLTPEGQPLFQVGEYTAMSANTRALLAEVVARRSFRRTDIHREARGNYHIDWLIPLHGTDDGASEKAPVALVLMRADLASWIKPMMAHWPVPRLSAEIQIVRRVGEDAEFLAGALSETFGGDSPRRPPRYPVAGRGGRTARRRRRRDAGA